MNFIETKQGLKNIVKFHWCCYVVCQTCTYNEWVTVCKWTKWRLNSQLR